MEFTVAVLVDVPAPNSGCEVCRADITADFRIGDTAVLDERIPDEGLSVLDNERQRYSPTSLRHYRETVSQEQHLRLHAGWRILNTNAHSCCVPIAI
ncbi:Uncharacterised protein [Enterobacter hormaechei]|nr:Uncharacterised protein [Enterobacter hormaechei]